MLMCDLVEHAAILGRFDSTRHKISAAAGVRFVVMRGENQPVLLVCKKILCRATIVAYNVFADGFGKVADIAVRSKGRAVITDVTVTMATTQGGTRDMGTQLTTLVMWHKQLELKLRGLNQ